MNHLMNGRPSLKDVAKLAGVSVSTVSRVSSNHPDVSQETRRKVEDAMHALGYRPSTLAQGLVSGRSHTIALLVSDITNPFYPQMAYAVEETASKKDYVVFLCNTDDNAERSKQYIDRLLAHGVDGIVHASVGSDEEYLRDLVESGFPIVFVNRRPTELGTVDLVTFDSVGGAKQAVNHLVGLGHRKIGVISGPLYISTERERLAGFRQAMEENKIPVDADLLRQTKTSRQAGREVGHEMLAQNYRPTAVIANDIVAYGVMDAALDLGIRVPEDLSIVGFGAVECANFGSVRLTTISSRIPDMGRIGCQRLVEAIDHPGWKRRETVLKTTLIEGQTTSKPPR